MKNNQLESQLIWYFIPGITEGKKEMCDILGNKGAALAEMSKIGVPVPPGFTISHLIAKKEILKKNILPKKLKTIILTAINVLNKTQNLKFGCKRKPLLLSIRSGATISMPGMMETILNLGLNDQTVLGLATLTGDKLFAYDCYRRFIEMYSHVVLGIDKVMFNNIVIKYNIAHNIENIYNLIQEYYIFIEKYTGKAFPQNLLIQLEQAILAVLNSWNSNRAKKYRQIYSINPKIGIAVNIQSMVFGNKSKDSATGVIFTRNPSTGEKEFFGEFLIKAQGQDIVSGSITPLSIYHSTNIKYSTNQENSLEYLMPQTFFKLQQILKKLESHYQAMQEVEFTIDNSKIWILQTRSGKRSNTANIKILLDMHAEGLIKDKTVLNCITTKMLKQTLHTSIDPKANHQIIGKGLPASPGTISGKVMFSTQNSKIASTKPPFILVRHETSPDDIGDINSAAAILTSKGGMTSHAAVVARGMGKPCVTGVCNLFIDIQKGIMQINNITIQEGENITIDGNNGNIFLGNAAIITVKKNNNLEKLICIATKYKQVNIRTNAETTQDILLSKTFYSQGIGLCRTEHMLLEKNRLQTFRTILLTTNADAYKRSIQNFRRYQEEDLYNLLKLNTNMPIAIRLLDPPLHEFLPSINTSNIKNFSQCLKVSINDIKKRILSLREVNPMLGNRGIRLITTFPEIYNIQIHAILSSALQLKQRGVNTIPEIIVPLVMNAKEFCYVKQLINKIAKNLFYQYNNRIRFFIGSMIELPSAAINIAAIAREADFISIGTNDLTQTCLGISRDDASQFLNCYKKKNILNNDPFITLEKSVKTLIRRVVRIARKINPKIKVGVCGEHTSNPESIKFFIKEQVDYISCAPFSLPIAQITAAKLNIIKK